MRFLKRLALVLIALVATMLLPTEARASPYADAEIDVADAVQSAIAVEAVGVYTLGLQALAPAPYTIARSVDVPRTVLTITFGVKWTPLESSDTYDVVRYPLRL